MKRIIPAKNISQFGYKRYAIYSLNEVFDKIGKSLKINGFKNIPVKNHRLLNFHKNGVKCVKCGISGKFFAVEKSKTIKSQNVNVGLHLNLYAVKNGEEILMTVDHIIPVSLGGTKDLNNLQTMCRDCNKKKGCEISWIIFLDYLCHNPFRLMRYLYTTKIKSKIYECVFKLKKFLNFKKRCAIINATKVKNNEICNSSKC